MANTITHQLIEKEALSRGLKCQYYGINERFLRIEDDDGKSATFRGSRPNQSAANGTAVTGDKFETFEFMGVLGYGLPPVIKTSDIAMLEQFLVDENKIVIKPIDSYDSNGVTVDVTDRHQIKPALDFALSVSDKTDVLAQRQLEGDLFRIFVLEDKVVAVTQSKAAEVTGDGVSTLRTLVDNLNAGIGRGDGSTFALQKINLSDVEDYVPMSLRSVPGLGIKIRITRTDSVSSGGSAINVTDTIHSSWSDMAVRVSQQLGLHVAGFDIITKNISIQMDTENVPLLEINSRPGLKIHEYPARGEPVHLAPLLLDSVF